MTRRRVKPDRRYVEELRIGNMIVSRRRFKMTAEPACMKLSTIPSKLKNTSGPRRAGAGADDDGSSRELQAASCPTPAAGRNSTVSGPSTIPTTPSGLPMRTSPSVLASKGVKNDGMHYSETPFNNGFVSYPMAGENGGDAPVPQLQAAFYSFPPPKTPAKRSAGSSIQRFERHLGRANAGFNAFKPPRSQSSSMNIPTDPKQALRLEELPWRVIWCCTSSSASGLFPLFGGESIDQNQTKNDTNTRFAIIKTEEEGFYLHIQRGDGTDENSQEYLHSEEIWLRQERKTCTMSNEAKQLLVVQKSPPESAPCVSSTGGRRDDATTKEKQERFRVQAKAVFCTATAKVSILIHWFLWDDRQWNVLTVGINRLSDRGCFPADGNPPAPEVE
nr:uncharacterized protein LOC109154339 [Ipomoea batatas]